MSRIFAAPRVFIVGNGEISRLAGYVSCYGSPILLIAHIDDAARVADSLEQINKDGIELVRYDFSGEATKAEVKRAALMCSDNSCKAVIGLGGGKAIDVAKTVANELKLPSVIVPTIASTDAPCSKLAVHYNEDHSWDETVFFQHNPDLVLVDSGVIARAPVRFLIAGLGDAFATYYEARACMRSGAITFNGGLPTITAYALAETCYKVLLEDSLKALAACRANVVTPALENIIEANILLSGLGFESVGLAVAHGLHDGFKNFPETNNSMHGEIIAVGLLVQLILEDIPFDELNDVWKYYKAIGLPTSLKGIGITQIDGPKMRDTIKMMINAPGSIIHNMPFKVTEESLFDAMVFVEELDELFSEKG